MQHLEREFEVRTPAAARDLDGRVQRLERTAAETRAGVESEAARLRNELSLAVLEFGHRLDERLHESRALPDASALRDAQATCARLADDTLAAVEATQRKVEELGQRTEASQRRLTEAVKQAEVGLEVLRVDVTCVRAELANAGCCGGATAGAEAASAEAGLPLAAP